MTRVFAWKDLAQRRRMFDGTSWIDIERGQTVVMIVSEGLDPVKVINALNVDAEPEEIK